MLMELFLLDSDLNIMKMIQFARSDLKGEKISQPSRYLGKWKAFENREDG